MINGAARALERAGGPFAAGEHGGAGRLGDHGELLRGADHGDRQRRRDGVWIDDRVVRQLEDPFGGDGAALQALGLTADERHELA